MINRIISRVISIFDVILTSISYVIIFYCGYSIIVDTSSISRARSGLEILLIVGKWVLCIAGLVFLFYCLVANKRLFQATKARVHPKFAIELCKLWWILSWISTVIAKLLIVVHLYLMVQSHRQTKPYGGNEEWKEYKWKCVADFTFLVIRWVEIYCVHRFKFEMKAVLEETMTETMTQISGTPNEGSESGILRPGFDDPYEPIIDTRPLALLCVCCSTTGPSPCA